VETKQKYIAQIMTGKFPVRFCEDVDETALDYATIKALCAGDARIREKMDLDVDVARLRLLKADHKSQHFTLEDDLLKHYPEQIAAVTARIAGIEKDIALYEAEMAKSVLVQESLPLETGGVKTPDGVVGAGVTTESVAETEGAGGVKSASVSTTFPPMNILGVTHTEKEPAAKALAEALRTVTGKDAVNIGSYLGFAISAAFDSYNTVWKMTLKGSMSYTFDLGKDPFGNITRMNHTLADLPKHAESNRTQLASLNQQVKDAEAELRQPFAQETELAEKEERLSLLNAELNIDGSGELEVSADIADAGAGEYAFGGANDLPVAVNMKRKPSIQDRLDAYNADSRPPMPGKERPADRNTL
jgi:hypothetical protein